ncbi:MAG: hypothetical protein OQJ97_15265 [Rhodospirillales bacterium]|nr:hypothetical protein [Rhodospirillales bacterium]
MSKYTMTIHTVNNIVGHFFMEIKDPKGKTLAVRGFGPEEIGDHSEFSESPSQTKGESKDDSKRLGEIGKYLSSKPISLSKEEADKAKKFLEKPGKDWEFYSLNDRNCVDFANEAIKKAGLKGDVDDYLSKEQRRKVNAGASYSRFKFGQDRMKREEEDAKGLHDDGIEGYDGAVKEPSKENDLIEGGADDDELKGGEDDDYLRKSTLPQKDKEVEAYSQWFQEQMNIPGDQADELLGKQMEDLTEDEVYDLMKTPAYQSSTDPRREKAVYTVKNWFDRHYGTESAKYDSIGKMIEPELKIKPPKEKQEPKAGNGEPMEQAVQKLGKAFGMAAKTDGKTQTVQGLQEGLNLLASKLKAPHNEKASSKLNTSFVQPSKLKLDGLFGPKTLRALKGYVSDHGVEKIKDGLAMGRLAKFTEQTKVNRKPPFPLYQAVDKAVEPLYGKEAKSMSKNLSNGRRSTLWGEALQHDLNEQGSKLFKQDWQPIKTDGDLGPKTENAFSKIAQDKDPHDMVSSFGDILGFWNK